VRLELRDKLVLQGPPGKQELVEKPVLVEIPE
jgi:hypothetical protein